MSNWMNEPDGDGLYWLRLGEDDGFPNIAKLEEGMVYEFGCTRSDSSCLNWYSKGVNGTRWQWQKVKSYEQ